MKNNNGQVVRRLSGRSLKNNKIRNLFAVTAIALTCMLFTIIASLGMGMTQVAQESTMREVGGSFHAGLKAVTKEEMEAVVKDPRVVDYSWNILIGRVQNLYKRSGELRYTGMEKELENCFIEIAEGKYPEQENEVLLDTLVLEELKVPAQVGQQVTLEFSFMGELVKDTFTVSGWYEGDRVSHASQIYVSESYWKQLKGDRTDADFMAWKEENPSEAGQGLYNPGLYFENARNIEETVRSIITDAGYEPSVEVDYGVNWAYMENRSEKADPLTLLVLGGALLVVILTGYLIIYNIFQISVLTDIRFYGLLKTIGTTRRQIRSLVRRQALALSLAGIPLGLLAGYGLSKVIFPFALSFMNYGDMKIALRFHPVIVVFAVAFSLLTVLVSCGKPGKIAGSVSPVEAVRYSEGNVKRKRGKKSEKGARVYRMALSNLGRNRKKTFLVILSLSLSLVLLCVVLTGVKSFRLDGYLESRLVGDITIGSVNYTAMATTGEWAVDPAYGEWMDQQPGIITRNEMWCVNAGNRIQLSDEALERYRQFYDRNLLRRTDEVFERELQDSFTDRMTTGNAYSYDPGLLENLKVLEGTLDVEKFQQGGYLLVTPVVGVEVEPCVVYEPGENVTLELVTEDTVWEDVYDENGYLINSIPHNLREQEFEVMAVVEIPGSMDMHRYSVNGVDLVMSLADLEGQYATKFAVSYTLEEGAAEGFEAAAWEYTEQENTYMGYLSKQMLMEEFGGMVNVIQTLGIGLGAVIALIGIMNFVNSIFTGIISRKRELAILCSIGMTRKQLRQMLAAEGLWYVLFSGLIGIGLGSFLSYSLLTALNQMIRFFEYRYNGQAFLIMLPLFALISLVLPQAIYSRVEKESIVERLRDTEG